MTHGPGSPRHSIQMSTEHEGRLEAGDDALTERQGRRKELCTYEMKDCLDRRRHSVRVTRRAADWIEVRTK